ncbi:unnamed protein product [Lepeophtheirus salmonis]|uniref:(salmon louse) hypothetical protein n=1 Tax=Lepeophtheirus salmonis TaxID=72036 RepID=A0A7R8CG87_LEPSM|nr:unnamed protein product [Lepeophtheirus salmonis]CAF2766800.1 unnamed protein product [Lepeophtheirus salmonis]
MTCKAGTYLSVANKGGNYSAAHVHSAKHKTAERGERSSSKVTNFFVSKIDTSVTAAFQQVDNCSTNFGEIQRPEEGRDVFANLKKQNKSLIGVGCPAHILNTCVHHGADTLDVDIENIIFKMYQHFHIYTVRTESLMEYCEFADIEQREKKELSFSLGKLAMLLNKFFEDEFSEIYLSQMHSLMGIFQTHIQEIERENNSVVEVKKILDKVLTMLHEHRCMVPMEEFSTFMWMDLSEIPDWNYVEGCIRHLAERRVEIDDVMCFDQVTNLKKIH